MKLLKHQQELLTALKNVAKKHACNEIIYKTEWLGYLPFGQYHWLELSGETIEPSESDSLFDDLTILTNIGNLKFIKKEQINQEDRHFYYMLVNK